MLGSIMPAPLAIPMNKIMTMMEMVVVMTTDGRYDKNDDG